MSRETPAEIKGKFFWLLRQNVSANAAATACGIDSRTGYRLITEARKSGMNISRDAKGRYRMGSDSQLATTAEGTPFGGGSQPPPTRPDPAWNTDQPVPPPRRLKYDPRYHGHTFKAFSAPQNFDGWDLNRVRSALTMHRQGLFIETSTLSLTLMMVPSIHAAMKQRIAPSLGLPKHVVMGQRGISRIVGEEVRAQICPALGLMPSPYFPSYLWGTMAADIAMMGYSVLQHVMGPPDEETGVQPVYTRRWPLWAVQYYRYRRTYVALTTEGPVDIVNDGKFTLVSHDHEEPHFFGAIVALAEEGFDTKATQRARSRYIDAYGDPKWVGIMPQHMAPKTPEGEAFADAIEEGQGPDGIVILPNGAQYKLEGLSSDRSTVMNDALGSNWQNVAATLLGSDGTMTRGTGVYSSPVFAGVRRDLLASDLRAELTGANGGHVNLYCQTNYSDQIERRSNFQLPVANIPLPDPDSDQRIKSYSDRVKSFHEIIESEKANGFEVTQERVEQLCKELEIEAPSLVTNRQHLDVDSATRAKVVTVKEVRESQGLKPFDDERDDMTMAELDALAKSKANNPEKGASETSDDEPVDGAAQPERGANESSSEITGGGGTSTGGETKPATGAPAPD